MSIDKIDLVRELEYLTNFEQLGRTLIRLSNSGPEIKSERLDASKTALAEIGMYVSHLEQERKAYYKSISMYREDKIRAINRALRAEGENEELKKKLTKLEKAKKLGL